MIVLDFMTKLEINSTVKDAQKNIIRIDDFLRREMLKYDKLFKI